RLVTVDRSEILGIIDRQGSLTPCRIICVSWLGQIVAGCPIDRTAMTWAHDWAIDQFSAMTATAAAQAGVRYLELNGAFNAPRGVRGGRERPHRVGARRLGRPGPAPARHRHQRGAAVDAPASPRPRPDGPLRHRVLLVARARGALRDRRGRQPPRRLIPRWGRRPGGAGGGGVRG